MRRVTMPVRWIGIHRDALRYQGLVFIITLAGNHAFAHVMTGRHGARPSMTAPDG